MIPSGTQFIGFSDSVNLTERRSASVNSETGVYTLDDMKGYKVYTALVSQSGQDSPENKLEGNLTIGVTYQIGNGSNDPGDFLNVGAPNNNEGTYFVATGETPTYWGKTTLAYNTGAPIVTVLENTLDDQLYWTYYGTGTYIAHSDRAMLYGNAGVLFGQTNTAILTTKMYVPASTEMWIETFSDINSYDDNLLNNTLVEIRVYN